MLPPLLFYIHFAEILVLHRLWISGGNGACVYYTAVVERGSVYFSHLSVFNLNLLSTSGCSGCHGCD